MRNIIPARRSHNRILVVHAKEKAKTKEKEEPNNYLEYFAKFASIFAALVTFMGCVDLYFYYGLFGINIFDYIDLSEAFVHFLDTLVAFILYIAFIGLICAGMALYAYYVLRKKNEAFTTNKTEKVSIEDEINEIKNEISALGTSTQGNKLHALEERLKALNERLLAGERKEKRKEKFHVIVIMILIIAPIILIDHFWKDNFFIKQFLNMGMVAVAIVFLLFGAVINYLEKDMNNKISKNIYRVSLLFLGLICFGLGRALSKHSEVLDSNENIVTQIKFSDSSIMHANERLIGKTKSYIFLYNTYTKTSGIIPADKVEEIIFRNNSVSDTTLKSE